MTIRASRLASAIGDPASVATLVDSSLQPGGAISLGFSDGIVHVMLDQAGDWTITAGLSIFSDRLVPMTRSLEELGFFQATEQAGMIYHFWTSTLQDHEDQRTIAEDTLLRVLKSFQSRSPQSYIG